MIASLVFQPTAAAHEGIFVGPYQVEIGWVNEPPLLGEANGIYIGITVEETGEPVEGVNSLLVYVSTGGEERGLDMHPLGEGLPGQYAADIIPTVRGTYTVRLAGSIKGEQADVQVDVEEVELAEDYQFPVSLGSAAELADQINDLRVQNEELTQELTSTRILAIAGLVAGIVGVALGAMALRRRGA